MPDRIRVDESVAPLVRQLRLTSDNSQGVFTSYFQILVFAACLGQYHQESMPVVNPASEPDPVRLDIFANQKVDYVVDLLALANCADPKVLSESQESIDKRCLIFESYANAGLHYLKNRCVGDKTPLMIVEEIVVQIRASMETRPTEVSLSGLLTA